MKAAVWKGINILDVEEVPDLDPRPDQVKVKVEYCGICGSDIHLLEGNLPEGGRPPRVIGHEMSGVVVETGAEVRNVKVGQRVVGNFINYCGACYFCRNGQENFCQKPWFSAKNFAQYALFREQQIVEIPHSVSLEEGALTEPVSVCVHAVESCGIKPGGTVAIMGAGAIGLLLSQVARLSGAAITLVSEPVDVRRNVAKLLGNDYTVDPTKEDLVATGIEITSGRGFNYIFEASGVKESAQSCLKMLAPNGTLVFVGVFPQEMDLNIRPYEIYDKEYILRGTHASPYAFHRTVKLLPKLQLKPIITHIVSLDDILKGFKLAKSKEAVKVMVHP